MTVSVSKFLCFLYLYVLFTNSGFTKLKPLSTGGINNKSTFNITDLNNA